jgi:hypothetical protein
MPEWTAWARDGHQQPPALKQGVRLDLNDAGLHANSSHFWIRSANSPAAAARQTADQSAEERFLVCSPTSPVIRAFIRFVRQKGEVKLVQEAEAAVLLVYACDPSVGHVAEAEAVVEINKRHGATR